MSIIHDNDFKNGYKHGMRLLAVGLHYTTGLHYNSDSLLTELHDDAVNQTTSIPTIKEWLDEHNAMSMNAHELDKTLTEYEKLVNEYEKLVNQHNKRLETFIAGMKAANFTVIGLIILLIVIIAFLLTLIP